MNCARTPREGPTSKLTQHTNPPGSPVPCNAASGTQESGPRSLSSRASSNLICTLQRVTRRKPAPGGDGSTAGLHGVSTGAIAELRVATGCQRRRAEAQPALGSGSASGTPFGGARSATPQQAGPGVRRSRGWRPGPAWGRITSSALRRRARVRLAVRVRALCGVPLLRVHDQQHVDGYGVAVLLQLHGAASSGQCAAAAREAA